MIVTDEAALRIPSVLVKDVHEGGEVARKLTYAIQKHNKKALKDSRKGKSNTTTIGVGLAAPQIGIHKRVVVVLVNGVPLVLMNPVITRKSDETVPFTEGCLSFPGEEVQTVRHAWVEVEALNHPRPLVFGDTLVPTDAGLLRAVAVQHELDHLDGILFKDRARKESSRDSHPDACAV